MSTKNITIIANITISINSHYKRDGLAVRWFRDGLAVRWFRDGLAVYRRWFNIFRILIFACQASRIYNRQDS